MLKKSVLLSSIMMSSLGLSSFANATIVEFKISYGGVEEIVEVNLFDQTTPKTVENFLTYLDEGHYTNSLIHRVSSGFVVQGGGFSFTGELPLVQKEATRTVINEPVYSNVKGTIAMAKLGGQPDSASDQWFFNLSDNSSNLDLQNEGFTVFGQVIGDGMAKIEKIAQLKLCNAGNLEGIPISIDDNKECSDLTAPSIENFVLIEYISIIDSSEVTDADLEPVKNTLITVQPEPDPEPTTPDNDSGGGTFTWISLFGLALLSIKKRLIKA